MRSGYGIFWAYPDTNLVNNTVQTVPFNQTQTVFNDRPPVIPTLTFANFFQGHPIVSGNPSGQVCPFGFVAISCSSPGVTGGPVHLSNTYVQEWNFSLQRQITSNLSLDLAYVGNKTTRLSQFVQRNDPPPGSWSHPKPQALSAVGRGTVRRVWRPRNLQFLAGEARKPRLARFVLPGLLYV